MKQWWNVKVYDAQTSTTTTLNRFGTLPDIKAELKAEEPEYGWQFVSARPEEPNE